MKSVGFDEGVVQNEIGFPETPHRSQREELRIAGTGPNQGDEAGHFTSSADRRSS